MKQFFTKISSFTLALIVLFSTMSFTVEKHFCGDFLVDVSYFGNADSCATEMQTDCDNTTSIKKKSCCKDELQQIEGQDEIRKSSFEDLDIETKKFVAVFVASYINLFKELHNKVIPYKNYSPPYLAFNFQTLYEVFIL